MPQKKRPCARLSSIAMRWASWNGLWLGRQLTPVPSVIVVVRCSAAAMKISGAAMVLPFSGEVFANPGFVEAKFVQEFHLSQIRLQRHAEVRAGNVDGHHEVAET